MKYTLLAILLIPFVHASSLPEDDLTQPTISSDIAPATFTPSMATFPLSSIPSLPLKQPNTGTCPGNTCGPGSCNTCWETCGSCSELVGASGYGCPSANQWALSFDDGPSDATPVLLDTLKSMGIKATFCILGGHAVKYPDTVKRMYAEGHQICSHSWSHPHLMSLSTEQLIAEVVQASDAIKGIIGVRPKFFRPPYGEFDERVLAVLKATGHVPLLWNMDTRDYVILNQRRLPASRILSAVQTTVNTKRTLLNPFNSPGFVSLQHDTFLASVQQETGIVQTLRGAGYTLMTVAQCLGDATPYKDENGGGSGGNATPPPPPPTPAVLSGGSVTVGG